MSQSVTENASKYKYVFNQKKHLIQNTYCCKLLNKMAE